MRSAMPWRAAGSDRSGAGLAVRHLSERHAVPRHGPRDRGAARAARRRGRLPARADVLRADAHQHRLRATRRSRWCGASSTRSTEAELIVSPSASCVATVREEYPRLAAQAGDPGLRARGRRDRAPRVLRADRTARRPARRHGRRRRTSRTRSPTTRPATRCGRCALGERPLRAAARRSGARVCASCPRAAECCGFGGTFAVKNADTSMAMLADKVRAILDTGAECCVAVDNSCLMHIGGGAHASARRACGRCTSPRSSRTRPEPAPSE